MPLFIDFKSWRLILGGEYSTVHCEVLSGVVLEDFYMPESEFKCYI